MLFLVSRKGLIIGCSEPISGEVLFGVNELLQSLWVGISCLLGRLGS